MKVLRILLLMGFFLILLVPVGCSYASIRGQVIYNGVGLDSPDTHISFRIDRNVWIYRPDADDEGYFRISPGQPIFGAICQVGKTMNIDISTIIDGKYTSWVIRNYVIMPGVNDLGKIDIGDYGFELLSPAQDQIVTNWPTEFKWSAYNRPGVTPRYSFGLVSDKSTYVERVYSADCGTETARTLTGTEPRINETRWWSVSLDFELNGLSYGHGDHRYVTLVTAP